MNPLMVAMNMGNGMNNGLVNIVRLLKSGNPEQIAQQMMQKNPKFKQFIESNKGKTPEQVAKENGVDLSQFYSLLK